MKAKHGIGSTAAKAILAVLLVSGAVAFAEEGVASWYGPGFHGKRSADGSVFDKELLTAAHRDLPFGTYLMVRNLDNGSSVVVRVTDRGPFAKERVLDLSEAAARHLGMIPTGTARVSFEPLRPEEALAWTGGPLGAAAAPSARPAAPSARPAAPSAPSPAAYAPAGPGAPPGDAAPPPGAAAETRWRIQVASYSRSANASATVERLRAAGLDASIERSGPYHRVVFASLSADQARTVQRRLEALGYKGVAVTASRPLGSGR